MAVLSVPISMDDDLFSKIQPEYLAENYTSAVKTAILYLTEEIRERTDLDSDGDPLVTKAFSEKNPLIKINRLESESDRSEQVGFMNLLQGLYKAIRNPRNHNLKVDTKAECDELLVFVNYLVKTIKAAKPKFDYQDFLRIISDRFFICDEDYSSEIAKSVPKEKLGDVATKLMVDISESNWNNAGWTIWAIRTRMADEERERFLGIVDGILLRTADVLVIRAATIILREDWSLLSKATRIRLESVLFGSLKSAEFVDETQVDKYMDYEIITYMNDDCVTASHIRFISKARLEVLNSAALKPVIERKLREREHFLDYFVTNFGDFLFHENYMLNDSFEDVMIELMESIHSPAYRLLASGTVNDKDFYPRYSVGDKVKLAIKRLQDEAANF